MRNPALGSERSLEEQGLQAKRQKGSRLKENSRSAVQNFYLVPCALCLSPFIYAVDRNPRRTKLSGKRAISYWKHLVFLDLSYIGIKFQHLRILQGILVEDGLSLDHLLYCEFHLFHI